MLTEKLVALLLSLLSLLPLDSQLSLSLSLSYLTPRRDLCVVEVTRSA